MTRELSFEEADQLAEAERLRVVELGQVGFGRGGRRNGTATQQVAHFDRDGCVSPLLSVTLLPLGGTLAAAGEREHQLTRVLRDSLQATVNRLQWGQLLLATVGAISPFVGLLGKIGRAHV